MLDPQNIIVLFLVCFQLKITACIYSNMQFYGVAVQYCTKCRKINIKKLFFAPVLFRQTETENAGICFGLTDGTECR